MDFLTNLSDSIFYPGFFTALLAIIVIDLVLAGDNAIVIGMAARNLPKHLQRKAIIWGTFGAVALRVLATLVVVWLLKVPGLLLVGGLLLVWIAYKLLADKGGEENIKPANSIWSAIRTIIIADAVMGLDNMLAVAGAAHGNWVLVLIGLLISIPIIVWGSTIIIRLINRFPWIAYIGAGVLAFTAGKMISVEGFLYGAFQYAWFKWPFIAVLVLAVLAAGFIAKSRPAANPQSAVGSVEG